MTLRGPVRRALLAFALAASLLAAGWVTSGEDREESDLRPVTKPRASGAAPAATAPAPLHLELLKRAASATEQGVTDLFASKSWFVPPPPPPPQTPAAPTAPALPYAYMGRIAEGGKDTVVLTRADKIYIVKSGDVIDATYRVDSIDAVSLTFTYMPLNQQQNLQIRATN